MRFIVAINNKLIMRQYFKWCFLGKINNDMVNIPLSFKRCEVSGNWFTWCFALYLWASYNLFLNVSNSILLMVRIQKKFSGPFLFICSSIGLIGLFLCSLFSRENKWNNSLSEKPKTDPCLRIVFELFLCTIPYFLRHHGISSKGSCMFSWA